MGAREEDRLDTSEGPEGALQGDREPRLDGHSPDMIDDLDRAVGEGGDGGGVGQQV